MEGKDAKADLQEHLKNLRLCDCAVRAAFIPKEALNVTILAELHDNIDLGARDERVVVLNCVLTATELGMDVYFIQGLESFILRHQVSL